LAEEYLSQGDAVYAVGKTLPKHLDRYPHFFFFPYDLSETFMIRDTLNTFFANHSFDIVILNAGVLGDIQTLDDTVLVDIKDVMEINVWANKELIDTLAGTVRMSNRSWVSVQVPQSMGLKVGEPIHSLKHVSTCY